MTNACNQGTDSKKKRFQIKNLDDDEINDEKPKTDAYFSSNNIAPKRSFSHDRKTQCKQRKYDEGTCQRNSATIREKESEMNAVMEHVKTSKFSAENAYKYDSARLLTQSDASGYIHKEIVKNPKIDSFQDIHTKDEIISCNQKKAKYKAFKRHGKLHNAKRRIEEPVLTPKIGNPREGRKSARNQEDKSYYESPDSEEEIQKDAQQFVFDVPIRRTLFDCAAAKDYRRANESSAEQTPNCPVDSFCRTPLIIPYSPKLQSMLEKYRVMEVSRNLGECSISALMQYRDKFCIYHAAEATSIPEGIAKGYIFELDFEKIREQLMVCLPRLQEIAKGNIKSIIREKVSNSMPKVGALKRQSYLSLMIGMLNKVRQAENMNFGYYGWTGYNFILRCLTNTFNEGKFNNLYPQNMIDYLQLVLAPEACISLIALDQGIDIDTDYEKALQILEESSEFGSIVHDTIDENEQGTLLL